MPFRFFLSCFLLILTIGAEAKVELGVDLFFAEKLGSLKGAKVGLVTNHTGLNGELRSTIDLFLAQKGHSTLVAIFSPEHGLSGSVHAGEKVGSEAEEIPIYSLYGENRRPTEKMLQGIDLIVYDIQEIGIRPYTYATTLFYVMEEAAKKKIRVVVLDRPNPLGGLLVDGPMLNGKLRSFLGYINVPYCHGMTIGELARFFNGEYQIGCDLEVVAMRGWKRSMLYRDTGLEWIPTSPNIPEPDTPFYCAATGMLGELELVNIGIGYTLPFKIIGAPWISGKEFAAQLNGQNLPGVLFAAFSFRPFYGPYKGQDCQGVKILITDHAKYRPLSVQYLLIGMLKSLYPKEFSKRLNEVNPERIKLFTKVSGNEEIYAMLLNEKYVAWKLIEFQKEERNVFLQKREKYLLY